MNIEGISTIKGDYLETLSRHIVDNPRVLMAADTQNIDELTGVCNPFWVCTDNMVTRLHFLSTWESGYSPINAKKKVPDSVLKLQEGYLNRSSGIFTEYIDYNIWKERFPERSDKAIYFQELLNKEAIK